MIKDREERLKYNREYLSNLYKHRRENRLCLNCGEQARTGKTQCQKCSEGQTQRTGERRKAFKRKAVEYLGGQCKDCGLRTDIVSVYDFHHVNSDEKDDTITHLITKITNWEGIQKELEKCILLCANCHRMRHAQE